MFSLSTAIQASEDFPSSELGPICDNPCTERNCCFNCCQKMCECIDNYSCTRCCALCCTQSFNFFDSPKPEPQTCAQHCGRYCINTALCCSPCGLCSYPCIVCYMSCEEHNKRERERNAVPEDGIGINVKKSISPGSE